MKTNKLFTVILAITVAVNLLSCKGDTGPQGPAGANGNANVKESVYTVTSWTNGGYYFANLADANLTSSVQSSGTTSVFLSVDGGNSWQSMPFTQYTGHGSPFYYWSINLTVGNVMILWAYSNGAGGVDPNTYYSTNCQFKVVDIPASIMKRHPNTNWHDWVQVNSVLQVQKTINNQ